MRRYDVDGPECINHTEGDYVKYEDVQQVLSELEEYKRAYLIRTEQKKIDDKFTKELLQGMERNPSRAAERIKELEAHVERLREALGRRITPKHEEMMLFPESRAINRADRKLLEETPAQSLAAVRREAVLVPTSELTKLEEARVSLYEFLEGKISEQDFIGISNITGQIWRVANTKEWN